MTTPAPMKLEHVIARAMAELRLERNWTQTDLAQRMSSMGLGWTPNRVTQLETLRRPVSLFEVAALSWVFEVSVTRFLEGDQRVLAPDGRTVVPVSRIRAAFAGDTFDQELQRIARSPLPRHSEGARHVDEIRRVAMGLEIAPSTLGWLSREMFGRTFTDEREARLGDVTGMSKTSARTKRGHVTRALVAEVRERLEREGRDQVTAAAEAFLAEARDNWSKNVEAGLIQPLALDSWKLPDG